MLWMSCDLPLELYRYRLRVENCSKPQKFSVIYELRSVAFD